MATLSTEQTINEKKIRDEKLRQLKNSAQDWLSYNRKVLKAEVSFLKKVQEKRTAKKSSIEVANNIRPFYLKTISEFLGS